MNDEFDYFSTYDTDYWGAGADTTQADTSSNDTYGDYWGGADAPYVDTSTTDTNPFADYSQEQLDDLFGATATPVAPSGPGYYNEITGQYVNDTSGGLQNPLTNETSGNADSMKDWKVDPATGTWTNSVTNEKFTSTPWNPAATGKSGAQIMASAGVLPWLQRLQSALQLPAAKTGAPATAATGGNANNSQQSSDNQQRAVGAATAPKYTFLEGIGNMLPIQTIAQMANRK